MRKRVAWIILIFTMLSLVPTIAQDNLSVEIIGDPIFDDTTNTVTLDVVVQGERNLELTNLRPANFNIGEPSSNLIVTAERRLPIAIAIIVDLSFGSDDDLIRDTLRSFFLNYYQPDDEVTFYILDGATNEPRVETINSLEAANEIIDGLEQHEPYYFITDALNEALTDLRLKGSSPVRPRAALYVSSLLSRPSEVTASVGFSREDIPLHVVQVHRRRNQQAPLFRQLANNGLGLFSNNQAGTFVLNEVDYQAVNTLKILFDTIDNMRLVYRLNYTTRNQSLLETQAVPLTVSLNDQYRASTNFAYSRTFNPPQIEFANIADLTVNRVPFRDDDGRVAFSRNIQTITIKPSFNDGVEREIVSMRLEVIDAGTENVLQSTLSSDLDRTIDNNYALTWNLDTFGIPDTLTDVVVRVTAFDALGLTAFTERPATISVAAAPPLPTPTPLPTLTPSPVPTVSEPTPVLVAPIAAATSSGTSTPIIVENSNTTLFVVAIIVLILVTLILLFRVMRFWRDGGIQMIQYNADGERIQPMERADIIPNNLEDMPTPTPDQLDAMEEDIVLAQLVVTHGFDSAVFERRIIPIKDSQFLIGRSEDGECDLVINVPYVSPRHCVIEIEDGNQFSVRDLSSKNGTYVNDERIPEDESMPAPLGSEIGITKSITVEIWDAEMVLDSARFDLDGDGDDDAMEIDDTVEFKPLPGLKYVDDDRGTIGNDYEPI